jgi:hypothetical protein
MHKLMNKDKIILRFTARMTPGSSVSHADAGRRFVLSYLMMDDSLLIFEPPVRNSGIIGGKFLERQRVYKPQSEEIYTYKVGYMLLAATVQRAMLPAASSSDPTQ